MRLKVVILVFLSALGILALVICSSQFSKRVPKPENPEMPVPEAAVPAAAPVASLPASQTSMPDEAPTNPAVTPETPVIPEKKDAAYINERTSELMSLAMNDDSNSFNTIWSELTTNRSKEIRASALRAVIDFGDRSVTNRLHALAEQTHDPSEKQAILQAEEYLSLPPLELGRPAGH